MREDLNEMVKKIYLKKEQGRYSDKYLCKVVLFNDEVIDFADSDKLLDLCKVKEKCGTLNGFIKSRELVEEEKTSEVVGDFDDVKTYFCVKFVVNYDDGERVMRMFPVDSKIARGIISEYYKLWKSQQKKTQPQQAK